MMQVQHFFTVNKEIGKGGGANGLCVKPRTQRQVLSLVFENKAIFGLNDLGQELLSRIACAHFLCCWSYGWCGGQSGRLGASPQPAGVVLPR